VSGAERTVTLHYFVIKYKPEMHTFQINA